MALTNGTAPRLDRRTALAFLGAAAGSGLAGAASAAAGAGAAKIAKTPRVLPPQRVWSPPPQQAPAKEGLADLPNAKLWYWDTGGEGEPLVLLHPATGSAAIWAYQQPVFARAGYRVIAYSRRGHWRSEPGPRPGDLGTGVDDLVALMDMLKVDRFHLLGSAAGGFVVPDAALSIPDRLLSLTFACTQGGVTEPTYRQRISMVTPQGFSGMPASFRELGPSYRAANRPGVEAWEALEQTSRAGARVNQPSKNRLLWPDIERIRTPSLVFTGAADLYMPVPLMLEYASHLADVETAIFAESGHSAYWEQPDAFNALVLQFLRKHRRRR